MFQTDAPWLSFMVDMKPITVSDNDPSWSMAKLLRNG